MHTQTCTHTRLQVLFVIELTYHFERYFPLLSLPVSGKTLATLCEVIYLFILLATLHGMQDLSSPTRD